MLTEKQFLAARNERTENWECTCGAEDEENCSCKDLYPFTYEDYLADKSDEMYEDLKDNLV